MTAPLQQTHLVVIGSSAGGIEALSRLVATLPVDFPAAIVLAQHLDPGRPSRLAAILERHSALPVCPVTERASLEPGVILVVPANEHVTVTDNEIRLSGPDGPRPSPSINELFTTSAEAYGENLIAVILTGTGSDGAAGARQVKEAGGIVIIENPETAEYPSMPQSLSPTFVDFTVDLEDVGPTLHRLLTEDVSPVDEEVDTDNEIGTLLDELRRESNIDFSRYRTPTIQRRLQRRMIATRCNSLEEYREHLKENRGEYQTLVSSFLIKVTEFFRDEVLFDELRETVLPEVIEYGRKNDYQLRFWSAGCATGEEAYSLAILLSELLGNELHHFNIRIFATDLDLDAIEYARRGVYPVGALRRMPRELIDRYFTEYGGEYEVSKIIRSMVIFGQHDLGRRSPFPRIDLVLCRNVLIYFTEELQQRALQTFAFSVRHDGFLALGKSESAAPAGRSFTPESTDAKIYRRHGEAVTMPLHGGEHLESSSSLPGPEHFSRQNGDSSPRPSAHKESGRHNPEIERSDSVLYNLPAGVAVVDAQFDIVMINNLGRRLLGIHGIAVGEDIVHLTRNVALGDLRDLIDRAFRDEGPVEAELTVSSEMTSDGEAYLHVVAYQKETANGEPSSVVLMLSDVSGMIRDRQRVESKLQEEQKARQALDDRAKQLVRSNLELYESNSELASANEQLRSRNHQLKIAHEEAQVSAEEIETLNEELQATNEELETLNEELQATVEELNATNEDMQARTAELQVTSVSLDEQRQASEAQRARLEAVLASMGEAVLVIDADGGATPMNPERCQQMFGEGLDSLTAEDTEGIRLALNSTPLMRARRDQAFSMQFTVNFPDSGRRWFEANARPIEARREARSVLVVRDITDSSVRRLQEEFMSVASHELRTPLTALRGYLEMLNMQLAGSDERLQRRVEVALTMVDRMVRLISDLLDVGRLQSGKFELVTEPVDIGELVTQAIELGQSMTRDHSIEVDLPDEPVTITVDPMRVQQVLLNLIANAISYSPKASRIDVRVQQQQDEVRLEVQDYGQGMSEEVRPQIFDRFFQGARAGHSAHRGLGLGLFITREIVNEHGGRVEFDSEVGEGSTFRIIMPIGESKPETNADQEA